MTDNFYNLSEEFLTNLCDEIEKSDTSSIFEVDYSDGILNIIIFKTDQQYVINRHNANQKIWYSSPISGADYFAYNEDKKQWLSDKGIELKEKLVKELESFDSYRHCEKRSDVTIHN